MDAHVAAFTYVVPFVHAVQAVDPAACETNGFKHAVQEEEPAAAAIVPIAQGTQEDLS